jgi:hypothetical protein
MPRAIYNYMATRLSAHVKTVSVDVRFWPKADMGECTAHVCF